MELRQYLDILKRHKLFIIEAVVVVGLAAGIMSSMRTPAYTATARVLLTPNDPTEQLNPSNAGRIGSDPERYAAGQRSIISSEGVAAQAAKSLQGVRVEEIEETISVSQAGQSDVLRISATHSDPLQARSISNAVAHGYIENRRLAAVGGLERAAKDIEDRLAPLQATIAQLDVQIGQTPAPGGTPQLTSPIPPTSSTAPAQSTSPVSPPAGPGGLASAQEGLKAARYAAAVQYETLYARQQELLVDISLKRGEAELIAEAKTPTSPVSPRPKRDAALGVLVGLMLGVGISVLREHLDDKVRSAKEVEQLTGLPLLAHLPYDDTLGTGLAVHEKANSPLSESIRSLRTSIQYLGVDRPVKVIVVTSPLPREGKSLVAANLAAAFADGGSRTLLVSADLRRPSINGLFPDLDPSPGLVGVVIGLTASSGGGPAGNGQRNGHGPAAVEKRTVDALLKTPVEGLLLLPSGPPPPNPAELLGSSRMATVLDQLSALADIVVIDSPPLLPVTDAAVLAARADGVLLVTSLNETPRTALERSRTILEGTGARILGVVINKGRTTRDGYYTAYYGDAGSRPEGSRRGSRTAQERVVTTPAAS